MISAAAGPAVRRVLPEELPEVDRRMRESWGSETVVSRGRLHRVSGLPCLVAVEGDRWLGLAAWRLEGDECELVVLEAFERHRGTGTALLAAVVAMARDAGARRLWLVTTNDNTDALRFYQRRGMRLAAFHRDAITRARRELKPQIAQFGEFGIPIADELELEMRLDGPADGGRE
jgi:GNAT superfamily N-acetyltransferase